MLITNFASGELSPALNGRVDLRQYYQGASKIENFEIIPTGGIKRRPGTKRLAQLGGNNRIIPFIVDKNNVYVLEIGLNPVYHTYSEVADPVAEDIDLYYVKNQDGTYSKAEIYVAGTTYYVLVEHGDKPGIIYIWKQDLVGAYSVIQYIYTDYASLAEIKEIQYAQNYDTIIFVHRNYKPLQLDVSAQGVFTLNDMEFNFIPDVGQALDDDFDYIMIVAGANFPTKVTSLDNTTKFTYKRLVNGIVVDYTKSFQSGISDFYCIVKGKLYKWHVYEWVIYGNDPEIDDQLFTTSNKYPGAVAFFNNRLFFASTIEAKQKVWASAAPDNYGTRYNDFCTYKKYVTVNKVVKEADLHIFTCSIVKTDIDTVNHQTTLTNVTQNFAASGATAKAITEYFVSSGIVPVGTKVLSVTENTIVINTSDLALVWDPGDPEQGIPAETQKDNLVMSIQLWRTADNVSAEDYEYMVVANNVTTADCSLFLELASDENDAIMFMSSNRFLAIGTESSIWSVDPGISALSINAVMQGRYGSDEIQGMAVETATVYFAQGCKGIREFYYNGEQQAFQTNNIALLADHILRESKAIDFDYMTNPYSRLLIVRNDGTVAQMLYDKTNGIMAWSRFTMQVGLIKNIAVTRGDDENDLIFMVVKDGDNYFLELLDLRGQVYLDSWKVYDPESYTPRAGYSAQAMLYNATTDQTCFANDIPAGFINEGDTVYIGYYYTSFIKSMPVINNDTSGKRRIVALQVRFVDSYLPIVVFDDKPEEHFTTVQEVPYSGVAKVNFPGVTDRDVYFVLSAYEPKPVNILSVDAITS